MVCREPPSLHVQSSGLRHFGFALAVHYVSLCAGSELATIHDDVFITFGAFLEPAPEDLASYLPRTWADSDVPNI
jgi:hypothetical protein